MSVQTSVAGEVNMFGLSKKEKALEVIVNIPIEERDIAIKIIDKVDQIHTLWLSIWFFPLALCVNFNEELWNIIRYGWLSKFLDKNDFVEILKFSAVFFIVFIVLKKIFTFCACNQIVKLFSFLAKDQVNKEVYQKLVRMVLFFENDIKYFLPESKRKVLKVG